MRILALPLMAVLSLVISPGSALAQQVISGNSTGLSIPAVLHKGIRANKAHAGDKVRFDLLEPISVGQGVVIPATASLYGHVVEARGVSAGSDSRLSIEVDQVVWRDHELPLHAFIYGLGIREVKYGPERSDCDQGSFGDGVPEPKPVLDFGRLPHEPDCNMPLAVNSETISRDDIAELRHLKLETKRIDGSTTLISSLKNVHLSGGVLIILRNLPSPSTAIPPGRLGEVAGQK